MLRFFWYDRGNTMISWSSKRQLLYLFSIVGIVVLLGAYPTYKVLDTPASCFDGKQNQDEVGIDCGGNSCTNLCESQVSELVVRWSQVFELTPGVYNVAAQIENPNLDARIGNIGYTFTLYDAGNRAIWETSDETFINARDNFVLFESGIRLAGAPPTRVSFEFERVPWTRSALADSPLVVKSKRLTNTGQSPRLQATIVNESISDAIEVDAVAVITDNKGNRIAVSSTFEKEILRGESEDISFTWPVAFDARSKGEVCTAPARVVLVFDRSGSMDDDGLDPPQPITDAKQAALTFVQRMGLSDEVGLVSFATTASSPIDQGLTADASIIARAIEAIQINPIGIQHTNLGDGIAAATQELARNLDSRVKRAMVVLTDGIASRPFNPSNAFDEDFPETYAAGKALEAQQSNISVYAIGLGGSVNEPFLKGSIASEPSQYFGAATSAELAGVYSEIAQAVCEERTFISEVFTHVRSTE